MLYSVHDLPKRLDLFNRSDWQQRIDRPRPGCELEIAACRDPLHWYEFGMELHAVWGFDPASRELRMLLGDPLGEYAGDASRYEDRRNRIHFFALLAPHLGRIAEYSPSLERVVALINPAEGEPIGEFGRFRNELQLLAGGSFLLEWAHGREMVMAALLNRSSAVGTDRKATRPVHGFREKFDNTIGRLYDYYFYRQQLMKHVPSAIFACDETNIGAIRRVFADPLAFDPREQTPNDAFLWPWQRSIGSRTTESGKQEVYYRPIPTTSIVLDIRASTWAMDLSTESAAFAHFIDLVVEDARRIIVEHDGFFDKETGDGIVGHFCHSTTSQLVKIGASSGIRSTVPYVAVKAGIAMVKAIQVHCKRHQKYLVHGLDGLGPAIGIHTGNSVWLAAGKQIRAIGPAVVGSVRLCSCAFASEIVLSNQSFQEFAGSAAPALVAQFQRRTISIKEYNERLGLYGHVLHLDFQM